MGKKGSKGQRMGIWDLRFGTGHNLLSTYMHFIVTFALIMPVINYFMLTDLLLCFENVYVIVILCLMV